MQAVSPHRQRSQLVQTEMAMKWEWQYNGVAPWEDIVRWCYANLQGEWSAAWETIHFKSEGDYAWFVLRWM